MRFSDEGRASSVLCQACGFSPRQKLFKKKKNAIPFSLSLSTYAYVYTYSTHIYYLNASASWKRTAKSIQTLLEEDHSNAL